MKKTTKIGVCLFILALSISGWAAYSQYEPEPPSFELVIGSEHVEMRPHAYYLEKWGRAAATDIFPDPVSLVKNDIPASVSAINEISLHFNESPESLKYYLWEIASGKLVHKETDKDIIQLEKIPVLPGEYALEVRATWKTGYALYYKRITIREVQ